jgi:hypothetical protein
MRPVEFDAADLKRLLEHKKVCTFAELTEALGTRARMTLFRKLAELAYLTSYSHRGKYYVLKSTCRFDESGLWSHRGIWFSREGTLLDTIERFVHRAPAGCSAGELDHTLHVQTRQALLELLHRKSIERESIGGVLVYLAQSLTERERQVRARRKLGHVAAGGMTRRLLGHEVKAALNLFFGLLDERQRRLFAGLEALKVGRGSDARVAALLGLDPRTVTKGRLELLGGDIDPARVRKAGGGRIGLHNKFRNS